MISFEPVAFVHSQRKEAVDDEWNTVESFIELTDKYDETSITGLSDFSHIEILYYFHKADVSKIVCTAEHPRENKNWPKVGIFAQRKKNRPNMIGATIAEILRIDGKKIFLSSFDAIDGTPVLDIKPVFKEYLPDSIHQPEWVSELMKHYW